MKFIAPEGVEAFTLGGRSLVIAGDRSVEIDERHADQAGAHGFKKWNEAPKAIPIELMTHAQLVLEVLSRTKETLEHMQTEELRQSLLSSTPKTVILPDETEAVGCNMNVDGVDEAAIDKMNRIELFAFLKAMKVKVWTPINGAELKAKSKEALRAAVAAAESVDKDEKTEA
jgi:hypothetical protein